VDGKRVLGNERDMAIAEDEQIKLLGRTSGEHVFVLKILDGIYSMIALYVYYQTHKKLHMEITPT